MIILCWNGLSPRQTGQKSSAWQFADETSAWGGQGATGLGAVASSLYHFFCSSWKESLLFSEKFPAFVVCREKS